MLAKVEVPYRVIDVAAGDLGTSAARKFDCEAWVPSQGRYRELTSTSNCTTFQARRLNIRYRDADGRPQTAATLNGTLATTRWIVAILENHQQPDGSVAVPKALQPFLGLGRAEAGRLTDDLVSGSPEILRRRLIRPTLSRRDETRPRAPADVSAYVSIRVRTRRAA